MLSEPRESRRALHRHALWATPLLACCSTLIGTRDSQVQGACITKAECAPGYDCVNGACTSGATTSSGGTSTTGGTSAAGGGDVSHDADAGGEGGDEGVDDNRNGGGLVDAAAEFAPCNDVSRGLIGHWTMDSSTIVGSRLVDVSANQNDGTLVGFSAPITVPGKFGQALSFPTNASAYVTVPALGLDQNPGGMNTISLWFYRNDVNVEDVLALLPDSPRYDLWLTHAASTNTFLCINTGNSDCFGVVDDTLTGRWVHVVAIFPNGPLALGRIYLDGVDRHAACLNPPFEDCQFAPTASQPVNFGGQTDFFFHGLLDDVRIYRRALTAAEAGALYSGTACP